MEVGVSYRREHLRLSQRTHSIVVDGGDQPNVVPQRASRWYFFRETDYPHIKALWEIGDNIAEGASISAKCCPVIDNFSGVLGISYRRAGERFTQQHSRGDGIVAGPRPESVFFNVSAVRTGIASARDTTAV